MRAMSAVVADELIGPISQQLVRQSVGEDPRLVVDDQMRGPRGGGHERGLAWFSIVIHTKDTTYRFWHYIRK